MTAFELEISLLVSLRELVNPTYEGEAELIACYAEDHFRGVATGHAIYEVWFAAAHVCAPLPIVFQPRGEA